jgi:hypothetical protein
MRIGRGRSTQPGMAPDASERGKVALDRGSCVAGAAPLWFPAPALRPRLRRRTALRGSPIRKVCVVVHWREPIPPA